MRNLIIKRKDLVTKNGESIAAIVVLPENNKFRIYVAWENEHVAIQQHMSFCKSRQLFDEVNTFNINETMGYGFDIANLPETKKIFKSLF